MLAIICDRCGAPANKPVEPDREPDYCLKKWSGDPRCPYEDVDLCERCQNSLDIIIQKFIRGEDVVVKALDWERR